MVIRILSLLVVCGCRDLRAKLELAVEHLLDVSCTTESCTREDLLPPTRNDDIPTDSEFLKRSPEVTVVVRHVHNAVHFINAVHFSNVDFLNVGYITEEKSRTYGS